VTVEVGVIHDGDGRCCATRAMDAVLYVLDAQDCDVLDRAADARPLEPPERGPRNCSTATVELGVVHWGDRERLADHIALALTHILRAHGCEILSCHSAAAACRRLRATHSRRRRAARTEASLTGTARGA
jgi:hypothetical protein